MREERHLLVLAILYSTSRSGCRADGATEGLNETIIHEATRRPGLITRMQRFLADPATMKAYLQEHCISDVMNSSDDFYVNYLSGRYGYGVPAAQGTNVCINTTYVQSILECATRA